MQVNELLRLQLGGLPWHHHYLCWLPSLHQVAELMAGELGWGTRKRRQQASAAVKALRREFTTPPPLPAASEPAAAGADAPAAA